MDYQRIIDKYYASGSALRRILMLHSRQVADKALEIAHRRNLPIDDEQIEAAAMLHDIGIFLTDAPGIECHGKAPYLQHGILGAELLRNEGAPEWAARVAERHTGAGLSAKEIEEGNMPLPRKDLLPETLLEQLICYADKFFSKSGDMKEKPLEKVRSSMAKFGEEQLARFDFLHNQFE